MKVRRKDEYRPLGDLNGKGAALINAVAGYLDSLKYESDEKTVKAISSEVEANDLLVILEHGQSGVASSLVAPNGTVKADRALVDTENLKVGVIFRLPPSETVGSLCIHIPNNRGVKSLLTTAIATPFHADFPDLLLEVNPWQVGAALQQAVDNNAIEKVLLVGWDRSTDRAAAAVDKWVHKSAVAKLELRISADSPIVTRRLKRFLKGDDSAFNEMVEFQGLTFETVKVEAVLGNGKRHVYNIEKPEAGHPITRDLGPIPTIKGVPTDDGLFAALRGVLADVP